jgi:hypothetical protein
MRSQQCRARWNKKDLIIRAAVFTLLANFTYPDLWLGARFGRSGQGGAQTLKALPLEALLVRMAKAAPLYPPRRPFEALDTNGMD